MRRHVLSARHGGAMLVRSGCGRSIAVHTNKTKQLTKQPICQLSNYISKVKIESGRGIKTFKPLKFKH